MNDSPAHFALRELRARFSSPKVLAILAALTLAIAVAGPFNTSALMPLPQRLAYWGAVTPLSFAAGLVGSALIHARAEATLNRWLAAAARALGSTTLVSLTLYGYHAALGYPLPEGSEILASVGGVLAICLVIEVIGELIESPAPATATDARPALLDRLPLDKRGALVALSAVDHYTEVTTTRGRHLLLLRLSDAIAEAAPTPGLQIHRSHWVALDQVRRAERQGDQGKLTLSSGQDLPIARARMAQAQAAGLFPK